MVNIDIGIDRIISNIKKIVDLTSLDPVNLDITKIWKVYRKFQGSSQIAIPFESSSSWLEVIQYVRQKSKNQEIELGDNFISNELLEFIYQLKTDNEKYSVISKSVNEWLENLKKLPVTNFLHILPINNVHYRMDLDFDKVKLKKLNLMKLKELIPHENGINHEEILNDLTSLNETEIFAIIKVQAKHQQQGSDLASSYLKRLIHTMRLFEPGSWITEREYYFPETNIHSLQVNLNVSSITTFCSKFHSNAYVFPTEQYWNDITPYLDILKTFLFSEDPNDVQFLILTALYWYGDACKETDDELTKFLKYVYGLESLLILDEPNKKKQFSQRLLKILNNQTSASANLLRQYYETRNHIIHARTLSVDKEDVVMVHDLLQRLIFEYIRLSKNYDSLEIMFKNEYDITIQFRR